MNELKNIIKIVGDNIIANKDYLTQLDQAIGDGDHGINMARGFEVVEEKLALLPDDTSDMIILKAVGMGLISKVGGASGPLFGTAFLKASMAIKDRELNPKTCNEMLDAAILGIENLGKATQGEKTMLDALIPAQKALKSAIDNNKNNLEIIDDMIHAAKNGLEFTKTIIATKGRASYLGERSIGYQDAGATTVLIMLQSLKEAFGGKH